MVMDLKSDVASCEETLRAHDQVHNTHLAVTANRALSGFIKKNYSRRATAKGDILDLNHDQLVDFLSYLVREDRGGFKKCVEAGLAKCTAEATILRNRHDFGAHTVDACADRLREYGLATLIPESNEKTNTPVQIVATSLTKVFADQIGIPLRNPQWSWGVYDNLGDRIILRIWEDHIQDDDIGQYVLILDDTWSYSRNGYLERKNHIEKLINGVAGFGIVCVPEVKPDGKRSIKKFYDSEVVVFGKIFASAGRIYARIANWTSLHHLFHAASSQYNIAEDLAAISRDPSLSESVRDQLIQARLGQGQFRRQVLEKWGGECAVSGTRTTAAIRASHVKPWKDSNTAERLDPNNGIPLVATLDALFDRLLISFDDTGHLLKSPLVSESDCDRMGLNRFTGLKQIPNKHLLIYLQWHRNAFHERMDRG